MAYDRFSNIDLHFWDKYQEIFDEQYDDKIKSNDYEDYIDAYNATEKMLNQAKRLINCKFYTTKGDASLNEFDRMFIASVNEAAQSFLHNFIRETSAHVDYAEILIDEAEVTVKKENGVQMKIDLMRGK